MENTKQDALKWWESLTLEERHKCALNYPALLITTGDLHAETVSEDDIITLYNNVHDIIDEQLDVIPDYIKWWYSLTNSNKEYYYKSFFTNLKVNVEEVTIKQIYILYNNRDANKINSWWKSIPVDVQKYLYSTLDDNGLSPNFDITSLTFNEIKMTYDAVNNK